MRRYNNASPILGEIDPSNGPTRVLGVRLCEVINLRSILQAAHHFGNRNDFRLISKVCKPGTIRLGQGSPLRIPFPVIADADPETDRLSAPVVLEGLTAQIFEIAQRWQRLGRMWISFFGIDTSRWAPLRGTLRYFRNRHPGFGTFLEPFLLCWMRRMGPKVFE
jgi:hypothetical protein